MCQGASTFDVANVNITDLHESVCYTSSLGPKQPLGNHQDQLILQMRNGGPKSLSSEVTQLLAREDWQLISLLQFVVLSITWQPMVQKEEDLS